MGHESSNSTGRWPVWMNATILLLSSWILIAIFSLRVRPDAEVVAAVFPPWWSAQQAFEATASANAEIVRTTAIPAIVIVRPLGRTGLNQLRQAGAWFAIDPQAVAACLTLKG